MAQLLPAGASAHLIFSFGANDGAILAPGVPRLNLADSLSHARHILTEAVQLAPTALIGPAPIADDPAANAHLARLCTALGRLCGEITVPYLPVLAALQNDRRWMDEALAGDGAHPDAGGYQALADLVMAWPHWPGRRL